MDTRLTLVLGGARSGKSLHAERLLAEAPPPWTYVATASILDDEMRERVALHRARRDERWRTVEAPLDLNNALAESEDSVLVDCLTLWLTNLMLGGHALEDATDRLESVLAARQAQTVLVSNEVGLGIVPDNALARRFRDAQGRLNQRMAALCGRVVFMVAGLPMEVK